MNASVDGSVIFQEVRGTFAHPQQMQDAAAKLFMAGFERADLSLLTINRIEWTDAPELWADPIAGEPIIRQDRGVSPKTAGVLAAVCAAGVVVATGGVAAAAVVAAIAAGGAAGGSVLFVRKSRAKPAQDSFFTKLSQGRGARTVAGDNLALAVRALTEAKQVQAAGILRASGALKVFSA